MFNESAVSASRTSANAIISWLRTYAEAHVDPAAIDERRSIPPHVVLDFGNRGLFGLRVPRRHGGLELTQTDTVRVLQQLAAIDLTVATLVSSHAIGLHTIQKFGRAALKEELLPELATGRMLSAFALTERVAGSNPRAIETRAESDGRGGWVLNGEKYFVDSASMAGVFTIFARTPEEGRASGISVFAVRRGTPGLTVGRELLTMGMRGMVQHDVHLRDVHVGADSILGEPGAGIAISQDTLSAARLNLAAKAVGAMKRCLQLLHRFATRRRVATGLLWNNPVTSSRAGQLVSATEAVQALVKRIAESMDAERPVPAEAFLACKVAASEYLWKSADALVQALGARGYDEANPASRMLRDARSYLVSEGPTETLLMYLGSRAMNTRSDLERYISSELNAPRLARQLRAATERIRERVSDGHLAGRIDPENEAYWASWGAGEIAMWAILAAAAAGDASEDGRDAAAWAELALEERTRAVLEGGSAEWGLGRGLEHSERIFRFRNSIGDLDQSAAQSGAELDPLLRPEKARGEPEDVSTAESEWDDEVTLGPGDPRARFLAAVGALVARHTLDETVRLRIGEGEDGSPVEVELDFSGGAPLEDAASRVAAAIGDRAAATIVRAPAAGLTVAIRSADGRCSSWTYDGRGLGNVSAAQLAERLAELVRSWSEQPGAPFDRLALIRREDAMAFLERWNRTDVTYPRSKSIHSLFERQAAATPGRTAVSCGGAALTYAELDRHATELARKLRQSGVVPGSRVGVSVGRSIELPVALLAVLKAGAAYVPLDTSQPTRRLTAMFDEMRFPVVVADASARALLPTGRTPVISPSPTDGSHARAGEDAPFEDVSSEQTAYVLYTSGSTGTPKAVEVCHRSVVNLLHSMQSRPGFSESDVLVAVTNVAFDIAALELFLPLVTGGRLVVANAREALGGAGLARLIEESGATVLQGTPAIWQMLIASGWKGDRRLEALCGGETLRRDLAERIRRLTGSLWNMYGPTETTIWSCVDEVTGAGPISIGRPIANTRVYILDDALQAVPPGVPGEIFIAGDGVAEGYWKRAELTAEKFLPDLLRTGERMYRTGDIGRFLPDGRVAHLGRRDRQVKIRGFRVELGEIEAAIESHTGVRAAVVERVEFGPGDTRLVGYVIPESSTGADGLAAALREHVQDRVPAYMVPASFLRLDEFPLTSNGKLDRRALAEIADKLAVEEEARAASPPPPSSADSPLARNVEREIAAIWSGLLRIDKLRSEDDFFALGGHSLLATQVVSRVRSAFRVEIPVETMFEQPTLAALVTQVERALQEKNPLPEEAPQGELDSSGAESDLSSTQQRFWFLQSYQPGSARYNAPVGLRLRGKLDPEALRLAIQDLVGRHDSLRTRFETRNGRPVQIVEPAAPAWRLAVVDLAEMDEIEREARHQRLAEEEAERSFELSGKSLFRTLLIRRSAEDHTLLMTTHHIVTDGWSTEVLLRDLAAFYRTRTTPGSAPPLPLSVQYVDYVAWEKKWLQSTAYKERLAYWREELANLPQLNLPTDRPRSSKPVQRGGHIRFAFSRELTASLHGLGRGHGATLFMVLMAGWQALLSRYSDQDDFGIGFPIANRTQADFEGVVGCFLNTLVIRADLSGDPTFTEHLARVRVRALKAYANQAVPFERLVQELVVRRDPARNPIFQAMLTVQNMPPSGAVFPRLESSPIPVKTPTSKLDLILIARERDGQLSGEWEYSSDLFDAATVQRLAAQFETLLEAAAADPDQPVAHLPLRATDSRDEILALQKGDTFDP
ncbi:MAG TPA: amino acid adenylation domain-containing protein [Thermoanaerobaculia bacterium]|nr:amino acid adenylation domain-containing protein [Thermoanaerobaculia bacterium]